jgi:hypothetical protein
MITSQSSCLSSFLNRNIFAKFITIITQITPTQTCNNQLNTLGNLVLG